MLLAEAYNWVLLPIGVLSLAVGSGLLMDYQSGPERMSARQRRWKAWSPLTRWAITPVWFWRYGFGGLAVVSGLMLIVQ